MPKTAGDVDANGSFDIKVIMLIQRHLVGFTKIDGSINLVTSPQKSIAGIQSSGLTKAEKGISDMSEGCEVISYDLYYYSSQQSKYLYFADRYRVNYIH